MEISSAQLSWMETDPFFSLTDLKLVHVCGYDGKEFQTPKTLGYYRVPPKLPIKMNVGIFMPPVPAVYEDFHCLRYLMQLPSSDRSIEQLHFCTKRGTLIKISMMNLFKENDIQLKCIKFRGCIYLTHTRNPSQNPPRDSSLHDNYLLKLHKHLVVDAPGDIPKVQQTYDHNVRNYGSFSANLGKFRLLYSSEIIGVNNSEPLGDLNDVKVLNQCRLVLIKTYPEYFCNWRQNYRMTRWLMQAYLTGTEHMKLVSSNRKNRPIKKICSERCHNLIKEQIWSISDYMKILHGYLCMISNLMADVDCPYTVYTLNMKNEKIELEGKNKESFLSQDYIDFVLGL